MVDTKYSMAVFATVGPYIYFYLQKRAEDRLLQDNVDIKTTLRQLQLVWVE